MSNPLAILTDTNENPPASDAGSLKSRTWTYQDIAKWAGISVVSAKRLKAQGVIVPLRGYGRPKRFDPDDTKRRLTEGDVDVS